MVASCSAPTAVAIRSLSHPEKLLLCVLWESTVGTATKMNEEIL